MKLAGSTEAQASPFLGGLSALVRRITDKIVFGKFLDPGRGPENGFTGGWIGLVAVVEDGELVNILGRLLVAGRNFTSALIEVVPLVGGILSEDKLPPGQRFRF